MTTWAAPFAGVFVVGDERTPGQDLAFSIRRIVEIAQRRAVTRQSTTRRRRFTASTVWAKPSPASSRREIPLAERFDDEGRPRVLATTAVLRGYGLRRLRRGGRAMGRTTPTSRAGLPRHFHASSRRRAPEGRKKAGPATRSHSWERPGSQTVRRGGKDGYAHKRGSDELTGKTSLGARSRWLGGEQAAGGHADGGCLQ